MQPSATADVTRVVLGNGLTLLVKENHTSPVAAVLAHVNVGYFNEPDHWSGIAHVVEHMFFKGTKGRPGKEQIATEIRALGGSINAGTYYDETTYYVVLPSAGVERAMEIQADTFKASLFDADELAKEIEVILQESKQKRDNPAAMLVETMYARAYDRHRIRRWRIGPDEVLRSLRHEDLAAFVGQTYRPDNITLTVVGDVNADDVVSWADRYWTPLVRGAVEKELSPPEPARAEFRYQQMRGDIQQKLVEFGFHAPPALHADSAPLMVLGNVLSDGRSSRLFRRLREEERLVSAAWAGYEGFADIGVFTLGAESRADDPLEAERGLLREVDRIAAAGVEEDELLRVKTRMDSRRLFAQEEVLGVARHLASYQALGDYRLADEVLARLHAVTSDDVRRVAAAYVTGGRATLLEYLPVGASAPPRSLGEMEGLLLQREATGVGRPAVPAPGAEGILEIPAGPGGVALVKPRRDLPVVALHVLFPGGRLAETPANAGITNLMLKSLLKGAGGMSAAEIASRVESLGTGIGLTVAPDYLGLSMKIVASRLHEGADVLRAVLNQPDFVPDEVEKEKQAAFAEIRRQRDSMSARAVDLFNAVFWGERGYGLPAAGLEAAIETLAPEDVRDWHRRWVHSAGAVIGVVGDIGEDEARRLLDGLIPAGSAREALTPMEASPPGVRAVTVDKQQTAAVMGFPGASIREDDRHALDVLAEITSGLAGRFFQAVRGENALAYAVSSFHRPRLFGGFFATYTATSPDNEQAARNILLAECERLRRDPVTDSELAGARAAIRGERVTGLQTFGAQAGELAVNRLYALPIDAGDRYLARVDALTAEDLRAAASCYLTRDRLWIGAVRGQSQ